MKRLGVALAIAFLLAVQAAAAPEGASITREAARAEPALVTDAGSHPGLSLHKRLPRDPLVVVGVVLESPVRALDDFLGMVGKIAGAEAKGEIEKGLREADEKIGVSLRDDLLAGLGPEFVFSADIPPIDMLVGMMAVRSAEGIASGLGRIGILAHVRDERQMDLALRRLFTSARGEIGEVDGLVRVAFSPEGCCGEETQEGSVLPQMHLFYGIGDGVLALGLSRDWTAAALVGRPAGERLEDGEDFARVFSHLDAEPRSLAYFNLPKMHALIRESQMIQGLLSQNEEGGRILGWIGEAGFMDVGIGATAVRLDGGGRSMSFGPAWITDGTMYAGLMAAVAIPNFQSAVQRGKQKRTMADIRSVGIACESFAKDEGRYPGPTEGWVPVEAIKGDLQPVYIRDLPSADGWGNAILYRSDGRSYGILSTGMDGATDREWTLAEEPVVTEGFEADILYVNGEFLVRPAIEEH